MPHAPSLSLGCALRAVCLLGAALITFAVWALDPWLGFRVLWMLLGQYALRWGWSVVFGSVNRAGPFPSVPVKWIGARWKPDHWGQES